MSNKSKNKRIITYTAMDITRTSPDLYPFSCMALLRGTRLGPRDTEHGTKNTETQETLHNMQHKPIYQRRDYYKLA